MDPADWGGLQRHQHLWALLVEQGATAEEIVEWLPTLTGLDAWPDRRISPDDRRRLLAALEPLLPTSSPVREALAAQAARQPSSLLWLFALVRTVRAQVSLLHPSFWLASAAITLLGIYLELSRLEGDSIIFLQALGPLLAYLSIGTAFRGVGLRTLEFELACPPSPVQLVFARLLVVLGYDVCLGLCVGAGLWHFAEASFIAVTLQWLMPLFFVAGVALILSLRLSSGMAAALAYAGWLIGLGLLTVWTQLTARLMFFLPLGVEVALGIAGLLLLAAGAGCFPAATDHYMPRVDL